MCLLIVLFRSSLGGWSFGSQEAALQDVDYISFLFSTLIGFSSENLVTLQEDESVLPSTPLSPLCLYPTSLEQFTHHWDVVEVHAPFYTHPKSKSRIEIEATQKSKWMKSDTG